MRGQGNVPAPAYQLTRRNLALLRGRNRQKKSRRIFSPKTPAARSHSRSLSRHFPSATQVLPPSREFDRGRAGRPHDPDRRHPRQPLDDSRPTRRRRSASPSTEETANRLTRTNKTRRGESPDWFSRTGLAIIRLRFRPGRLSFETLRGCFGRVVFFGFGSDRSRPGSAHLTFAQAFGCNGAGAGGFWRRLPLTEC